MCLENGMGASGEGKGVVARKYHRTVAGQWPASRELHDRSAQISEPTEPEPAASAIVARKRSRAGPREVAEALGRSARSHAPGASARATDGDVADEHSSAKRKFYLHCNVHLG
jgi:hypothetical protein